jgi:ATP-dependent Clp protease ATP-binding subunit ClpA
MQDARAKLAYADSSTAGLHVDRFTDKTQQVLAEATERARQFGHGEIRPEHVLLALLVIEGTDVLRPLMAAVRRVNVVELRDSLLDRLRAIEPTTDGDLRLSDGCKRVLQAAVKEAHRVNSAPIGPAHLLLGLVTEGSAFAGSQVIEGLAARGLRSSLTTRPWRPDNSSQRRAQERIIQQADGDPRGPQHTYTRDNVITFRVKDTDLEAIDALVASGAMRTRSEASAWLLQSGIEANREYLGEIRRMGEEIERLRQDARRLTEAHLGRLGHPGEQDTEGAAPASPEIAAAQAS